MHHLYDAPKDTVSIMVFPIVQAQVRFFALHRIKQHAPPLVRAPSIPLSFSLAAVLPGGALNALATARRGSIAPHT